MQYNVFAQEMWVQLITKINENDSYVVCNVYAYKVLQSVRLWSVCVWGGGCSGESTAFLKVSTPWTKGLVINYGEWGATKWENHGSETFCPPPQDRVKLFIHLFLRVETFHAHPRPHPSVWLKLQTTA